MNCLRSTELNRLASALATGARLELCLTPKPGLVDLADTGSHQDLSFAIMQRSIAYVAEFLDATAHSLIAGEPFECQKELGIQAEQCLYDNLGTNTHKGYIFLSGMLLIAYWHAPSQAEHDVRQTLASLSRDFFKHSVEKPTHGLAARKKYKAGGIVEESIAGFPSLFDQALPAFRRHFNDALSFEIASFAMMARLMQTVDDTTTLHRSGLEGLLRIKNDGVGLEASILAGNDPYQYLKELNRLYIELNMTIGGVADVLGLSYGILVFNGELPSGVVATALSTAVLD